MYTLVSILVSASIALSSSTIVGNAVGGLMIRFVSGSRVRPGDYLWTKLLDAGLLSSLAQRSFHAVRLVGDG